MVGIELVRDRGTKTPYLPADKIGARIVVECRKNGLIIRPLGDVIVLMPPLSISLQELKKMVKIVFNSIKLVTEPGTEVLA
jgi:adenosylmethionine-8-amino-7-oxononanoate aminotransferase